MNLAALAPEWLVWVLALLLSVAAVEDAARLRISNLISLAVVIAAFVAVAVVGPVAGLWQNVAIFAILLLVGTALFAAGKMGGGDIKLLAACGLWFDFEGAVTMLAAVLVSGGVVALLILATRLIGWTEGFRGRVVVLKAGGGIPYGIAIAAGALIAVAMARNAQVPPLDNWQI